MTHITHTIGFSPVLMRRRDDFYVDLAKRSCRWQLRALCCVYLPWAQFV